MREDKVLEFINLRQGNIMVKVYFLKFTQLARYVPHVIADSRDKMSKFVSGVYDSLVNEWRFMMLNGDINIASLIAHAQQIEKKKIKMREKQNKRSSFNFAQPK